MNTHINTVLKRLFLLVCILSSYLLNAQAPYLFNYQGIARDSYGNPMSKQIIHLKLSILPTLESTQPEFVETHIITTNEFGLYNLQIGNGKTIYGSIEKVKWENGNQYIQVAIDPTGGDNFISIGTTQLLSVPYAIYANKAGMLANEDKHTRSGAVSTSAAGTGTPNFVAKFSAANTIENAQLFDNGTNIGIGTTAPLFKLHIEKSSGNADMLVKALDATGAATMRLRNSGNAEFGMNKFGPNATGTFMGIPRANMAIINNSPTGPFVLSTGSDFTFGNTVGAAQLPRMFIQGSTGYVGVGTITPKARLHITDSAVLFSAVGDTVNSTFNHPPPIEGPGRRMMWYPERGAFRAGGVAGADSLIWNRDSIGAYSVAMGWNTLAKGRSSFAAGENSDANGFGAVALGKNNKANGESALILGNNCSASSFGTAIGNTASAKFLAVSIGFLTEANGSVSTALGGETQANGASSTAMGSKTRANGASSTAMGSNTKANGFASLSIGQFNDTLEAVFPTMQSNTPLLMVGNGTSATSLSNAFVVRNDGNAEIQNEMQRPSKTGSSNLLPICYGGVNSGGSIQGANNTGNYSVSKTSTGTYEITIVGETYNFGLYTTVSNALSTLPRIVTTLANAGKLQIRVFDILGNLIDDDFHFIVYKN